MDRCCQRGPGQIVSGSATGWIEEEWKRRELKYCCFYAVTPCLDRFCSFYLRLSFSRSLSCAWLGRRKWGFHISSSCCRPTFRQREAKHTHTHTVHTTTKHPPRCNTGRGWMGRNAVNNAIAHLVICQTRRTFAGMWHPTIALSQRCRLLHHGRPVSAQSQDC